MPVYNEGAGIEQVITELIDEIAVKFDTYEIVAVNDCSTDNTGDVLDHLASIFPNLTVVHESTNRGHGPAMRDAIDATTGDWIFQIDSDGQFLASDFWKLWEQRHEADLALGVREDRHDPRHRLILTRVVGIMISFLASRKLRDANVPFKLIRRSWWEETKNVIPADALAPSIMISLAASIRGGRIVEVPVRHLSRPHGNSTLRPWRLVTFSSRGLLEILRFRAELRR